FVYPTMAEAQADAARITANGYIIAGEEGQPSISVDWIAQPHFYQQGNLIVLYVGEDPSILSLLETVLGPPFTGN
ncbi:MAG: hypothetical protein L0322_23280, partial [Chloroflexi bacterium]|nr:hypothetical protein [Chloroflexota bacterium]